MFTYSFFSNQQYHHASMVYSIHCIASTNTVSRFFQSFIPSCVIHGNVVHEGHWLCGTEGNYQYYRGIIMMGKKTVWALQSLRAIAWSMGTRPQLNRGRGLFILGLYNTSTASDKSSCNVFVMFWGSLKMSLRWGLVVTLWFSFGYGNAVSSQ